MMDMIEAQNILERLVHRGITDNVATTLTKHYSNNCNFYTLWVTIGGKAYSESVDCDVDPMPTLDFSRLLATAMMGFMEDQKASWSTANAATTSIE
jgi:hypothetical protein